MPFKSNIISKYSKLIESNDSLSTGSTHSCRMRSQSCSNDFPTIRIIHAVNVGTEDAQVDSYDDNSLPENYLYNNSDHSSQIVEKELQPIVRRTYKRRFWILFIFSILTWFSCVQWNAWGPISDSMFAAFPDWRPSTVAMMENWVTLLFVFSVLPVCWIVEKIGLRTGILMSSLLFLIGLALRCISDASPTFTIMCHLCAILMGVSVTLILSAPPLIASAWFPLHERTRAVALIMAMAQLGSSVSYLEPLVIRGPSKDVPVSFIKQDIMVLMYTGAAIGAAIFLIILIYFPSKPPMPPTLSSSTDRLDFKNALLSITRNKNFVVIVLIYGFATGPSLAWIGVLNFSLKPLGFDQDDAMYVGLTAIISCFVVTLVIGWATDYLFGRLRETIMLLLLLASFSYYWFLLLTYQVIHMIPWQVYVSVTFGLSLNFATVPLFFELAVETAYPVPEVLVGGVVTASDSFFSSLFLFVYFFDKIGFKWVSYALVFSNALPIIALLFVKSGYSRFNLDSSDLLHSSSMS